MRRGGGLYGGKVKIAKRFSKSNFFSTNRLKNVLEQFFGGCSNLRRGGRRGLHVGKSVGPTVNRQLGHILLFYNYKPFFI